MAHKLGFPHNFHTTCDFMTAVIYVFEGGCNHVHVVVGICAAADAETEEVISTEAVLSCNGIAVSEYIADLTTADTSLAIKFDCQSLCRELLFGNSR